MSNFEVGDRAIYVGDDDPDPNDPNVAALMHKVVVIIHKYDNTIVPERYDFKVREEPKNYNGRFVLVRASELRQLTEND